LLFRAALSEKLGSHFPKPSRKKKWALSFFESPSPFLVDDSAPFGKRSRPPPVKEGSSGRNTRGLLFGGTQSREGQLFLLVRPLVSKGEGVFRRAIFGRTRDPEKKKKSRQSPTASATVRDERERGTAGRFPLREGFSARAALCHRTLLKILSLPFSEKRQLPLEFKRASFACTGWHWRGPTGVGGEQSVLGS
jgi:hypothetical protein